MQSRASRSWPEVSSARLSNAQKACIHLCSESAGLSMMDIHRRSCKYLHEELRNIGFRVGTGDLERILYPHFISHGIGIGEWFCIFIFSSPAKHACFADLHETRSNRNDRYVSLMNSVSGLIHLVLVSKKAW